MLILAVKRRRLVQRFQTNVIAPLLLTQLIIEKVRSSSVKKLIFLTSKMGSIEDNQGGVLISTAVRRVL